MLVSVDNKHTERVSYDSFEYIIEAPDIFLLFYDTRVTALQKSDLSGAVDAFRDFICDKVPPIPNNYIENGNSLLVELSVEVVTFFCGHFFLEEIIDTFTLLLCQQQNF